VEEEDGVARALPGREEAEPPAADLDRLGLGALGRGLGGELLLELLLEVLDEGVATNCWKTERPIPTQTIGLKKKLPPSRSLKLDLCSLFMAFSISVTRASRSILSPSTSSRISRARSCLPTEIKKRGDSGMAKESRP